MHRFPETIATKQDIDNIRNNHPEFHEQLKAVLQRAENEPTKTKITASYDTDPETGEMINVVEEEITRPNQQWKRWGFKSKKAMTDIIPALDAVDAASMKRGRRWISSR